MNPLQAPFKMQPSLVLPDFCAALNRATRTLVVVDVVESVRLMQADEAGTIDRWRRFTAQVRSEVLPAHQGRLVKSLGDGLLLEFEHVPAALAAALTIQRNVQPYNTGCSVEAAMQLRLGVHVAEVVMDELDVYGTGVNLTARLASLAGPGEIVVSAPVRDQSVPGLDAEFEDMGLCYLKHLNEPVQAYRALPALRLAQQPWKTQKANVKPGAGAPHQPMTGLLPSLAIIPFQVRNPQPQHLVLGELLADSLIAKMAGADSLRVISRLSTSALAQRACTVAEIGQLLSATFVVSGSVQANGEQLKVQIELADARSEEVIWTDLFSATVAELAERDCPVAEAIGEALVRQVTHHELRRVQHLPLPTLESFSLQLSGMALMHRSTKLEFDRARQVLEYLIERHPRAPEPRAWLAKWYVLRVTRNWVEDLPAESARALDHTQRALDISPDCSLALAMEGFVHCHMRKDLDAAEVALTQALAINPSNSLAWLFLCVVQGFVGRGLEAVESADQATALSPLDPLRHYYDGLACSAALAAHQLDKAIHLGKRSLQVNCNHLPTLRAVAIAQVESGNILDAQKTALKVLALEPGLTLQTYLARAPEAASTTRLRYAQALRTAGIPHQ